MQLMQCLDVHDLLEGEFKHDFQHKVTTASLHLQVTVKSSCVRNLVRGA